MVTFLDLILSFKKTFPFITCIDKDRDVNIFLWFKMIKLTILLIRMILDKGEGVDLGVWEVENYMIVILTILLDYNLLGITAV